MITPMAPPAGEPVSERVAGPRPPAFTQRHWERERAWQPAAREQVLRDERRPADGGGDGSRGRQNGREHVGYLRAHSKWAHTHVRHNASKG